LAKRMRHRVTEPVHCTTLAARNPLRRTYAHSSSSTSCRSQEVRKVVADARSVWGLCARTYLARMEAQDVHHRRAARIAAPPPVHDAQRHR
jgi:hypothetical protein